MVGYSRLIGLDDAGTLARLKTLRANLIDPAIPEFGGRIVQTGDDSLLIVFDSIDGAVRCAMKVQQQVPILDEDQPPDRAIRFRVGIDISDTIADGTDLHGDGVNVAARLQAECPASGVCVSRAVRDHVHGRLDLAFESIGELTLENIARPVEAFVLELDLGAEARARGASRHGATRGQRHPAWVAGAIAVLLSVTAGAGWWLVRAPAGINRTDETTTAARTDQHAGPAAPMHTPLSKAPQLSAVVLPFTNLGGVDDDTVDAITEDVTTDLARVPDLLVISRSSAFAYKGKPIDIKRVGEELGVRYAVEGSARRVDGRLRVTVQLVSTETGAHTWAERFEVGRDGIG
jgi:TolB-like protein